jgi:hypothetical protein
MSLCYYYYNEFAYLLLQGQYCLSVLRQIGNSVHSVHQFNFEDFST